MDEEAKGDEENEEENMWNLEDADEAEARRQINIGSFHDMDAAIGQ